MSNAFYVLAYIIVKQQTATIFLVLVVVNKLFCVLIVLFCKFNTFPVLEVNHMWEGICQRGQFCAHCLTLCSCNCRPKLDLVAFTRTECDPLDIRYR